MQTLFNDGWLFQKTLSNVLPAAQRYAPVALPHDWLIADADNLYESSDGWYKKTLSVDDAADGKRRFLRFDGVYMNCDISVNGHTVCRHPYGYTAFDAELTGAQIGRASCRERV